MNKLICCLFLLFILPSTVFGQDILMQNGTFNQCSGALYDTGGVAGSYLSNENLTITICPDSSEGSAVQLDFTFFDTQSGADILTIFNGNDTSASVIGVYSGTSSPGQIQATNPSGCLTINFVSNSGINRDGFEANISCATPCQDIDISILSTPQAGVGGSILINQGASIDFTADVNFSVDSVGATYLWDFGDGSFSEELTVSHTFNDIGTFIVTLTVTDSNPTGCSETQTITVQVSGSYLLIDQDTYTVEQLVEDVLINSSCAEVSNIVSSTGTDFGSSNGIGYFSGNGLTFPFTEGILLTTGDASQAGGPESGTQSFGNSDWPGDQDLANAIPGLDFGTNPNSGSFNATYIQFDFVPLANTIGFNFIFASEEYGTYQCQYTDAFAFLLTDNETNQTTNLALVPGTADPISVLSVRDNTHNSGCESVNEEFFAAYYGMTGLPENDSPIDFRGHTVSISAESVVVPNRSYTIKLVIADAQDNLWDAAVFLEAGSFDLGGSLGDDITIEAGNALCSGGVITLDTQIPGADHVWYLDGEIIDGESDSTIDIEQEGVYSVDIEFGEECSASDSILIEYKPSPVIESISNLFRCNAGNPTFDLSENDSLIIGAQDPNEFNISYHASLEDAENDLNPIVSNLTQYTISSLSETIYVRIEDNISQTCFVTGSFDLILTEGPPISDVLDLFICDDLSNDGFEVFDLDQQTSGILNLLSPEDYSVSYFSSIEDAELFQNPLGSTYQNTVNPEAIYVRIDTIDDTSCFTISQDPVFSLEVLNQAVANTPPDLILCDQTAGSLEATFDLSQQTATILGSQDPATFTVTYHTSLSDAEANVSPLPSSITTASQTIFVRVEEAGVPACYAITDFELIVDPIPAITTMTPLSGCDDDDDGLTTFTLTDKDTEALSGQTGLTVSYHASELDAESGVLPIGPVYTNTLANTEQIWIRLTNDATGCYSIMPLDLVVNPLPIPEPATVASLCDDDTDGLQTFDLSGVAAQVIGGQVDMLVSYHETQGDADGGINGLGTLVTTTIPDLQTIFIRLENTVTGCYAVSTVDLVVNSLPYVDLEDNYVICADASGGGLDYAIVDPGLSPVTYSFIWRDELGNILSNEPVYTVEQPGVYSLEVSYADTSACTAPLEIFTVSESGNPAVTAEVTTEPFADTHIIIATASGTGIYEFSLDQGPWQDSGTFIGVSPGEHTVNVRDVNGCGVTSYELFVIDYPPYFTPNGDGYNDTWNISSLNYQANAKIYIFDRYGKLLKQISPAGDGWDGTFNGNMMPTNDYWFLLEYNDFVTGEPRQLRAHFSLKR